MHIGDRVALDAVGAHDFGGPAVELRARLHAADGDARARREHQVIWLDRDRPLREPLEHVASAGHLYM